MPYVTVDGQRLFYLRRSLRGRTGPPVLLLHGAGGNALLWGRVLQHLPGADAIALDLPGHGRSVGPGNRQNGGEVSFGPGHASSV